MQSSAGPHEQEDIGVLIKHMGNGQEDITIGILDNDLLALRMLTIMMGKVSDIRIMWSADSAASAVQFCMNPATRPMVLLVDMGLEGLSGIDVCAQIQRFCSSIRFLGITAYSPEIYEEDAAEIGIDEVISKEDFEGIVGAVLNKTNRKRTLSHNRIPDRGIGLSERELEVMRYYAKGKSANEITQILRISKSTLFSYEKRAMLKLGTHTRTQSVARCEKMRLFG